MFLRIHDRNSLMLLGLGLGACMSQPATVQPPLARHKLVRGALADTSFRWQQHTTRHFGLYAPADSYAGAHLAALGRHAEQALAANLELLESRTYPRPMYLVFVNSRPEMTRLVGRPAGGYAEPGEDSAFFIVSPTGSVPFRHELMHILSFGLWGQPTQPEAWVVEGLGTLAPRRCGQFGLHQLAAALADEGRLVPLDTLMHYGYDNTDDVVIYAESASFLAFVHERYGASALQQIWQQGLIATAASLGTSPATLEAEWRAQLAAMPAADRRVDWSRVRTKGCE